MFKYVVIQRIPMTENYEIIGEDEALYEWRYTVADLFYRVLELRKRQERFLNRGQDDVAITEESINRSKKWIAIYNAYINALQKTEKQRTEHEVDLIWCVHNQMSKVFGKVGVTNVCLDTAVENSFECYLDEYGFELDENPFIVSDEKEGHE